MIVDTTVKIVTNVIGNSGSLHSSTRTLSRRDVFEYQGDLQELLEDMVLANEHRAMMAAKAEKEGS